MGEGMESNVVKKTSTLSINLEWKGLPLPCPLLPRTRGNGLFLRAFLVVTHGRHLFDSF
jgi:hypothetical protein